MAQYKDIIPNQNGWIHDLARAEIHPDAERLMNLTINSSPDQLIEESTVNFLTDLRERLTEHARSLNSYSETGKKFQEVKIYSLAESPADFMIFRNQVKLVFSNVAHGVIQVSFNRHTNAAYLVPTSDQQEDASFEGPSELIAKVGPFRDVFWTFRDERVEFYQVAKFFFAEFMRTTRQKKVNKSSNDLLLSEIRDILKDRGLEL